MSQSLSALFPPPASASAPRVITGAGSLQERTLAVGETVVLVDEAGGSDRALTLPTGNWGSLIRIVAADSYHLDCYLDISTSNDTVISDDAGVTVGAPDGAGVQHIVSVAREIILVRSEDEWRAVSGAVLARLAYSPRVARVEMDGNDATASIGGAPYASAQAAFDAAFAANGNILLLFGIGAEFGSITAASGWPARIQIAGQGKDLSRLAGISAGAGQSLDITDARRLSVWLNNIASGTGSAGVPGLNGVNGVNGADPTSGSDGGDGSAGGQGGVLSLRYVAGHYALPGGGGTGGQGGDGGQGGSGGTGEGSVGGQGGAGGNGGGGGAVLQVLGCELTYVSDGGGGNGGGGGSGGSGGSGELGTGPTGGSLSAGTPGDPGNFVWIYSSTIGQAVASQQLYLEDTAHYSAYAPTIIDVGIDGTNGGAPSSNRVRPD